MNLYAGVVDLNNKQYKLYTIEAEEIKESEYKTSKAVYVNYSTTLSKISRHYCDLMLHIGKTNEDRIYVYYSLNKDIVLNKMVDFVNKNDENKITINDIIII